jgi:hypothetical protein
VLSVPVGVAPLHDYFLFCRISICAAAFLLGTSITLFRIMIPVFFCFWYTWLSAAGINLVQVGVLEHWYIAAGTIDYLHAAQCGCGCAAGTFDLSHAA